ncbi:hypothetical protein INT43_001677 [Umbelopsis isabellina]|uniref:Short-chain dehydrogenase n=1 Tax=Mortierella isabellina TaxID=91625 RepID=A0A8H7PT88_MORIS|nr:hypothetical protein INT43_001677 [Umbelopsis isabellina]
MSSFNRKTTSDEAAAHFAGQIKGKTVLVTGASWGGLGAEAIRVIAKNGAGLVIMAGRRQESLDETAEKIKAETPNANLRSLVLDLASLESVRQAAKEVNAYSEPIDVLINNAAVMASPYMETKDGFEMQFGTNHLGHFLFTNLIFPRIMAAKEPRIVNISSMGHKFAPIIFEDPMFSKGATYKKWLAYGQAKTANILFSRELAKRYGDKGLTAVSLHPGGIITPLVRHIDFQAEFSQPLYDYEGKEFDKGEAEELKTLAEGTSTHIVAAFDPSLKSHNGSYLFDCQVADEQVKIWAKDDESAEKLWDLSEKLTGSKFE